MSKKLKKCIAIIMLGTLGLSSPVFAKADVTPSKAKNVIMFITDGTSMNSVTLARWYSEQKTLNMDPYFCGLTRTYPSDAMITDSAPGATAFSTGHKSHTGYIATLPEVNNMPGLKPMEESNKNKPVSTVLEGAKQKGKATGIVSTSETMHATPAAFSSHDTSRSNYDNLSEQQVYMGMDVVLGGGRDFFSKERKDGENLINEIKDAGYTYVTTPEQLKNAKTDKLWGLFADKALAYDLDRDVTKEPSLADMTEKAIETLAKDKDGFFLMVEGSKVDWASHANDPIGVISDVLAFDKAVGVGLEYAKKNQDTVVIVTSDHGNGGISIGNSSLDKGYDIASFDSFMTPLKRAKTTAEGASKLLNADRSNIKEVMLECFGISDLTESEIKAIKEEKKDVTYAMGPVISKRAQIGFTTHGHTGEEVFLAAYAPDNQKPTGLVENIEISQYMANTIGVNLDKLTQTLFVEATEGFKQVGATVKVDQTDKNNSVIVATKDGKELRLPVNKNIAILEGKRSKLSGVVVYIAEKAYVPQDAIDLLK
ncbi:MAG: alkaline phosphatase [Cellulosilyticaceae bacterium]